MNGAAFEIGFSGAIAPEIRAFNRAIEPARVQTIIGEAGKDVTRRHLLAKNLEPNRLGARKTNFYQHAGNATHWKIVGDAVVISVNSVGIAQRFFGGTIRPVTAKYLTIPATREAHGKRAGEFDDLDIVTDRSGEPYALARVSNNPIRLPGARSRTFEADFSTQPEEIVFWLKKEVTQEPDDTVLPKESEIHEAVAARVGSYVQRQIDRAKGPAA